MCFFRCACHPAQLHLVRRLMVMLWRSLSFEPALLLLKSQHGHADVHTVCSHFVLPALLPGEWSWTCRCGRRCRRRRRTSTCEASPPRCPRHAHPYKIQPDNLHFVCVLVVGTRSRSTRSIIFALSEVSLARPVPALVQCKHHCIRSCALTLVVLPE